MPIENPARRVIMTAMAVLPISDALGAGEAADSLGRSGPRVQPPLVMEADQERRTTTEVLQWLGKPVPG